MAVFGRCLRSSPKLLPDINRLAIAATPDLEAHGTDDKAAVRVRGVRKNYGKTQVSVGSHNQDQRSIMMSSMLSCCTR